MSPATLDPIHAAPCIALLTYYAVTAYEIRIHRMNARALKFIGIDFPASKLYRAYYFIALGLPAAIAVLNLIQGPEPQRTQIVIGGMMLCGSQLLRAWAIGALGNGWVMDLAWDQQWLPVNSGPYRLLNHPEYLSRTIDVAGFIMLFAQPVVLIYVVPPFAISTAILTRAEAKAMHLDVIRKSLHNPD